jgi:hypothetical protein
MNRLSEIVISNLTGVAAGLGTSFLSWWVLFHVIVPRIEFSNKISKRRSRDHAGHDYRVKILNLGRRSIVGVECIARLIIDWEGKNNWKAFYIPMNPAGERKTELPKIKKNGNRVLILYVSLIQGIRKSGNVPDHIKMAAEEGTLELEAILSLGANAKLKIYVSGYDEFSGARKVFESDFYSCTDIVHGKFSELEVIPSGVAPAHEYVESRSEQPDSILVNNTDAEYPEEGSLL